MNFMPKYSLVQRSMHTGLSLWQIFTRVPSDEISLVVLMRQDLELDKDGKDIVLIHISSYARRTLCESSQVYGAHNQGHYHRPQCRGERT